MFRDNLGLKRYENDKVHDWQIASSRQLSRMTDDAGVDLVFNEQSTDPIFHNLRVQIKREVSKKTKKGTARYSIDGLLNIKLNGVRVLLLTAFWKNGKRRDPLCKCAIIREVTLFEMIDDLDTIPITSTVMAKMTTVDLESFVRMQEKHGADQISLQVLKTGTYAIMAPETFFKIFKYATQSRPLSGEPGYKPELPQSSTES